MNEANQMIRRQQKICLFKLHFIPQWEMFIEASDILHIKSCLYILSFPILFLVYGFLVGFSFLYFVFISNFSYIYWVVFKTE